MRYNLFAGLIVVCLLFITSCVPCDSGHERGEYPGDAWIEPETQSVSNGAIDVKIVMHVNTGASLLAAYGISVNYNAAFLSATAVTAEPSGFVTASNFGTPGVAIVSGFEAGGKGPSIDLPLFNVTFNATAKGTSELNVTVDNFVDGSGDTIGTPAGFGGSITIQ